MRPMWTQIILSILLAAAAIQFLFYAAKQERVRIINWGEDFTVRYPRVYLWISVVLFALTGSLVLSMIIWHEANAAGIIISAALFAAAVFFLLRALIWHVDVRHKYMICVSTLGIKHLVHYEDIEEAVITKKDIVIKTPIKSFKMSSRVIYGEDMLQKLADAHVPIRRQ